MGDRSKREAERLELARKFEEAKNAPQRQLIRCRSCRKSEREVVVPIEMGGFVFCDQCIEAAAQIVAERKSGAEGRLTIRDVALGAGGFLRELLALRFLKNGLGFPPALSFDHGCPRVERAHPGPCRGVQ